MSEKPIGRVPSVGDDFHAMDDDNTVLKIKEVGAEIRSGKYFGAAILADDDVWYDCFWSFRKERFQYFNDDDGEAQE